MKQTSKNVLIISNYYEPEMGAASKRITTLAKSFKDKGHNVRVVCPLPNYPDGKVYKGYRGRLKASEVLNGIRVDRLWIFPSKSKNPLLRVLSMVSFAVSLFFFVPFIKRSTVDTVIVQSPPLFVSFSAAFLGRHILRKKVCLNVSDLWPKSALELGVLKPGKMYQLLLWMEKTIYKKSDLIIGQSEEIIKHVSGFVECPRMVYRNLPNLVTSANGRSEQNEPVKIVYAGLLGFAQGVLKICKEIDFRKLGVEFHVYGKGMEEEALKEYLETNPDAGIYFHGAFDASQVEEVLSSYDAALVPLTDRIYGAVPSKIFELIHLGIPIIFAGGGEGAKIVEKYGLGTTCPPGDTGKMAESILEFKNFDRSRVSEIHNNLASVKKNEFDYEKQFKSLLLFLNEN